MTLSSQTGYNAFVECHVKHNLGAMEKLVIGAVSMPDIVCRRVQYGIWLCGKFLIKELERMLKGMNFH